MLRCYNTCQFTQIPQCAYQELSVDDSTKDMVKAVAEGLKPFANLAERLFGGPFDQIGGAWEDRLKVRREIRKLKLMQKLNTAIADAGFSPDAIPDAIWIPAVQEALLQDDESLQEKWAAMLANAADPGQTRPVSPAFPGMLKDLTSRDVKFLDSTYSRAVEKLDVNGPWKHVSDVSFSIAELMDAYFAAGLCPKRLAFATIEESPALRDETRIFAMTLSAVERHNVIRRVVGIRSEPKPDRFGGPASLTEIYRISEFGATFICACQPPDQNVE